MLIMQQPIMLQGCGTSEEAVVPITMLSNLSNHEIRAKNNNSRPFVCYSSMLFGALSFI